MTEDLACNTRVCVRVCMCAHARKFASVILLCTFFVHDSYVYNADTAYVYAAPPTHKRRQ